MMFNTTWLSAFLFDLEWYKSLLEQKQLTRWQLQKNKGSFQQKQNLK